ncbi:MAG: flagellar basal body-associated FliL family protein [Pseudomonadota bacterium]
MKNRLWKGALGALCLGMALTPAHALAGGKSNKQETNTKVLKFKRPFVVPVGDNLRTQGMVVVSFNIEFDSDVVEDAMEREEIIRDRILIALMHMSHDGNFDAGIADPAIASMIKEKVLAVLEELYPHSVEQILIQDLVSRRVT